VWSITGSTPHCFTGHPTLVGARKVGAKEAVHLGPNHATLGAGTLPGPEVFHCTSVAMEGQTKCSVRPIINGLCID